MAGLNAAGAMASAETTANTTYRGLEPSLSIIFRDR